VTPAMISVARGRVLDFSSGELLPTRDRLRARFGQLVEPWWERLPRALAELRDRWALTRATGAGATQDLPTLTSRVEFLFDLWTRRQAANADVRRQVPMNQLERGRERARELAGDTHTEVLLHGDLHPGNVLDSDGPRGLAAIDPRPCVGDAHFDAIDWVLWGTSERRAWEARARAIASTLDLDSERCLEWCRAVAPILAASAVGRGEPPRTVEALLELAE
jgi:streptomycin 6-kinase